MTKRRSTKRALLLSALSLLMCVSMLIGSTFAWFTDSVTSKNNIIKSGNLDVELDYIKVVDGVATDWATVKDQDNIFNKDALWEPGHVEVVYLRVSNKGSLQLKYQLGVNVYKEIIGKNEKGEDIKLSDYLVFKTIEIDEQDVATFTRESAKAEAGTVTGLKDYNGQTTALEVGGVDYLALIVYMPETVGNEANYRGTDVPTIELGINLYATQHTAEEDSFDKFYDKDAWNNAMKVYNEADLATAIKNVEDGGLIVIADDLTLEKGVNSGSTWYEGYYYNGDKSFTIDLNGKTLTNAGTKINDYLLLFKNDGEKANTITLKNGTLEATSSAYCAICTSTTSTQKITINLENVNLIGNNSNGAVAKIRGGAELNVKAGTVITGKNSFAGIEAAGNNTVVNIFDGAEIYQNGTSSYAGSLVGASGGATVNVYGGSGVSAKGGFIAMTSGGTINVSGGEWIANTDGTYANSNMSVLIAQSDNRAKSVVNVYGGTFKGGYNCYGNVAGDAQINIFGGNFNANPATYVENGYKAVENNGKFTVLQGDVVATDTASLTNALANGGNIALGAGDFTMSTTSKDVTIVGTKDTKVSLPANQVSGNGNAITIEGVTIIGNDNGNYYSTLFNGATKVVYKNCDIYNQLTTYADTEFIDCNFYNTFANDYSVYCYSGNEIKFDGCSFDTKCSKAIKVYHEGTCTHNIYVNDCTFTTETANKKAAVEIDSSYNTYHVYFTGENTINGAYTKLWNSDPGEDMGTNVYFDGYKYDETGFGVDQDGNYGIFNADGLMAFKNHISANAFAHSIWGKTFTLLSDIDATGLTWSTVMLNTPNVDCDGFTVDGNGHTIKNLTIDGAMFHSTANGKNSDVATVFKDLTFDNVTVNGNYHTGIIWSQIYGDIELNNVHVINSNVTGMCNVGALIGRNGDEGASTVKFTNCSVKNTTVTSTGGGDNCGASAFLGMALRVPNANAIKEATLELSFENCVAEGNTLVSAAGHQGGGIYATADVSNETWNTPVVVNAFTNFSNK